MLAASAAAATAFGTAAELLAAVDGDSTCLHGALFVLGYALARRLQRRSGPVLAGATQASARKPRPRPLGLPALLLDRAGASEACLPLALAYLDDRLQRAGTRTGAECQGGVCARSALVALVLASKFHDDEALCTNAYYSELGGLAPDEFAFLEREFCRMLDWKFFVSPEEFERYSDMLYSAALGTLS
ncbi:unnamed protein product [Prorocentrum cordatum]|uniref:Cyclin N-terminal domain-containing protein n=1 Tax=Prorocentrum cordatum TaxID=2364126 RepID=A0ABN9PQN7_9DINO|nr:unnamed protein product [Polarella glacialis]